jgi:hypothetical protein
MQTAMELLFVGISLWVIWGMCTRYGRCEIIVSPIRFADDTPPPPRPRLPTNITIRAAAGARVVIR